MKRLLSILAYLEFAVIVSHSSPADTNYPPDIADYYKAYNDLTCAQLNPLSDSLASRPFKLSVTLDPPDTETLLSKRLAEYALSENPLLSGKSSHSPSHEPVLIHVTDVVKSSGKISLECEIYSAPGGNFGNVSPFSGRGFQSLHMLRREIHQWLLLDGRWIFLSAGPDEGRSID